MHSNHLASLDSVVDRHFIGDSHDVFPVSLTSLAEPFPEFSLIPWETSVILGLGTLLVC